MRKPNKITSSFKKLVRKLEGKIDQRHKFHDLRHTHVSQLLDDGHPITTISRRIGHANPAITLKIYSHIMPGSDETMMEEFGIAFEAAIEQGKHKKPQIV